MIECEQQDKTKFVLLEQILASILLVIIFEKKKKEKERTVEISITQPRIVLISLFFTEVSCPDGKQKPFSSTSTFYCQSPSREFKQHYLQQILFDLALNLSNNAIYIILVKIISENTFVIQNLKDADCDKKAVEISLNGKIFQTRFNQTNTIVALNALQSVQCWTPLLQKY